jgi:adenylate cyclase
MDQPRKQRPTSKFTLTGFKFQPVKARKLAVVIIIVFATTLLAAALPRIVPGLQLVENWLSDFRFTVLTPPQPPDARIVIVTINEDTLATFPYRSPVDRGFLIKLLNHLAAAKVRAIGIDILFDQPTEPEKDKALKTLIASFPVPVVVANTQAKDVLTEVQKTFLAKFSQGLVSGDVNLIKGVADGAVRGLYVRRPGSRRPQLGFTTALVDALGLPIPLKNIELVYRSPPGPGQPAFKSYPAQSIQFLPKSWLAGKIVLIGADLPLSDRHRTVFSAAGGAKQGNLSGVRIHAHALSQLLDNRRASTLSIAAKWSLLFGLAVAGMIIALFNASIFTKGIIFLASFMALWIFLLWGYQAYAIPLPFLAPNFALAASMISGIVYLGHDDRVQRKFIQQTFSRYLSPKIVDMLIANPAAMKVGGERRQLTYIFTDLENFTTLTEKSDPQVLVDLLNQYIDGLCTIAFKHQGTVDKIIGDAMCAFFGAPIDQPDHQARAVACALELDRFAQAFAAKNRAEGIDWGTTRIGVHSGVATIGNFGGENFFDYTAFGDMVNTAARLESINKHLGTRICISTVTAEKYPGLKYRPVGHLVLKGKSEKLAAIEPLTGSNNGSNTDISAYMEAFKAMEQGDRHAIDAFQRLVEQNPDDGLSAFHLKRLKSGETGIIIDLGEK